MFDISPLDIKKAKETLLISEQPLVIRLFPAKEKRKYILLGMMCHLFEEDKMYTEPEVNDILRDVYDDYVTLRRYLIIYGFLDRKPDGHAYWLNVKLKDFESFKA